jgi:hypothetical protein
MRRMEIQPFRDQSIRVQVLDNHSYALIEKKGHNIRWRTL